MTFPGTYNINYYYGDTLEFLVTPKDVSGVPFTLENYGSVRFNIAEERGALAANQIACYAAITDDKRSVLCAITPTNANSLDPTKEYVYDVEVVSQQSPYDKVYTLLTGTVSITRDVSFPVIAAPGEVPFNPTDLVINNIGFSSITASWTPPSTGVVVTGYKVAVIPYTATNATLAAALTSPQAQLGPTATSYTFFGLQENTQYSLVIVSIGAEGDGSSDTLLTNALPIMTDDNPLTLEPDFFVTIGSATEYSIDGSPNDGITVVRGESYVISVDAAGENFWIQTSGSGYVSEDAYSSGVNNNGTDSGLINWVVAQDTPNFLYYQSQNTFDMRGIITVIDGGS